MAFTCINEGLQNTIKFNFEDVNAIGCAKQLRSKDEAMRTGLQNVNGQQ